MLVRNAGGGLVASRRDADSRGAFSFDGPAALATGGNSGIGLTMARTIAATGAAAVVVGRDTAMLTATMGKISAEGGRAAFVAADLVDRSSAWRIIEETAALFSEPDILLEP